jgi:hypothetical protein
VDLPSVHAPYPKNCRVPAWDAEADDATQAHLEYGCASGTNEHKTRVDTLRCCIVALHRRLDLEKISAEIQTIEALCNG